MQKKNQFNKKFNKSQYNSKKKNYSYKNKNKFYYNRKNNIYYILGEKKPKRPLITTYLQRNKKIKTGMFFKKPSYESILYPFHLNLKLINEYLKKN
uniref:Ymf100 n=1 Tax=Hyaloperonospora arabidopsidis TaxID=272952 RepID=UPI0020285B0A|nr:Ymf100 [Hyaloperonospora arabidopsidis]DAZ88034.1 TPA_asm: Ymf100 [Hyaloperonospora arabidopsidis]